MFQNWRGVSNPNCGRDTIYVEPTRAHRRRQLRFALGLILLMSARPLSAAPAPQVEWQFQCGSRVYASPVVAELSRRPGREILVVSSAERKLICLSATRETLWTYDGFTLRVTATPTAADFDADGTPEILITARENGVICLAADGTLRWKCPVEKGIPWGSATVADADRNGTSEIYWVSLAGVVECRDPSGRQIWSFRIAGGGPQGPLAVGDVDGDGYALARPESALIGRVKQSLRKYFGWSFRMADNPFGLIRNDTGSEPLYFTSRDEWFGGGNSQYLSTAWAAYLAARAFAGDAEFASQLRAHGANQVHWIMGLNPLNLCMFEGKGNSQRMRFHHLYAEIPGHPRGAVPGAIPNGIVREPSNADRPWFDLRSATGSLPGAESAEPWLPHNAYYLLMLSASSGG